MKDIDRNSVLIITSEKNENDRENEELDLLIDELMNMDIDVHAISDAEGVADGLYAVSLDADVVIVDWRIKSAKDIVLKIRRSDPDIKMFLITDPESLKNIPANVMAAVNEYFWLLGNTPSFITGRIEAAAKKYRKDMLPPMFKELVEFSEDYEYSWHTPGHAAGVAFLKTPIGRLFYDFFGEQLFRSDLSISVGELGSLLDHSGPIGNAEKYAAKVFGADMTMFVTNGTSTSNRVVHTALTCPEETELVDRNCHKSIEHAITMSHAVPVYMMPMRNRYGIIGPIPPEEMDSKTLKKRISNNKLVKDPSKNPSVAVVTNSTYDGVCYHADLAEELLGKVTDCIHFDEAWYGYARFNPLYRGRFGMRERTDKESDHPTIFTTQSTHKLLAALSQASMIHLKQGKRKIDPSLFNEAFMMHASTSPQYAIIASLDVSSKMMDVNGEMLTTESIDEAIRFRQTMARLAADLKKNKGGWWFDVWQPKTVRTSPDSKEIPFKNVSPDILNKNPYCWVFHPKETWHGFGDIEDGWAMLDPIKVTVLTPGIEDDGSYSKTGIPSAVVLAFLDRRGIVNEKSGDYNILFLFSIGVTNGKWGTLVSELFEFKKLYDKNASLEEVLPELVSKYPDRYNGMTIRELADEMHRQISSSDQTGLANKACDTLPEQVMTPADAYAKILAHEVEHVRIDDIDDRILATAIVPYPPGIPLVMPGERSGKMNGPILSYMRALEEFDRRFPGFEHDSHGVVVKNGDYYVYCIKEK